MQLIKLSATDSTNAYLRRLSRRESVPDFTVVQAANQTAGRGQPGTSWEAEEGKNLTFSVLKAFGSAPTDRQFLLNIRTALAVSRVLEDLKIPGVRVKWPNDILSGGKKVCGILVENQLKGGRLVQSIIGIGLNVNQTAFPGLPGATSLKIASGSAFDLDELLYALLSELQKTLGRDGSESDTADWLAYERQLYLRDQPALFSRPGGDRFKGTIRGVDPGGRLRVEMDNGREEAFGFKEIRYLTKNP